MGWRQAAKSERARLRKKAIAAYKQGIAEGWIKRPMKKTAKRKKKNPATKVSGWVKVKAVKIIRNKKGQAVSVKMKT